VKPIEKKRKRDDMENSSKDKKSRKDKKDKKDKKDNKERRSTLEEASSPKKMKAHEEPVASSSNATSSSSNGLVAGRKAPAATKDRKSPTEFRESTMVTIDHEDSIFDPIQDFSELDFDNTLLAGIKTFSAPTPIQAQCWPIILAKRDVIGIAETGSGKTMAFSLPILYHLHGKSHEKFPSVLILAPTRELATQTAEVCTAAGATSGLRVRSLPLSSKIDQLDPFFFPLLDPPHPMAPELHMMITHFTTV
jgi:ATP-dependent RNA helicase DBP3